MRDCFNTYEARNDEGCIRPGEATAVVRLRAGAVSVSNPLVVFLLSFLFILLFSSIGWSITPSGTIISNMANATYSNGIAGGMITAASNTVSVTTTVRRTTAVIEFFQYAPTNPGVQPVPVPTTAFSPSGNLAGPFVPLEAPVPAGSTTSIDLTQPVPLVAAQQYHTGEPVFIRLSDGDQNNDPAVAETVVVTVHDDKTGDAEVLRLTETGPNTGVFTGFIQSSSQSVATNNGLLNLVNDSRVMASYTDAGDSTDTHTAAVMVDPYGIVFNSSTGQPVDGAIVTLVDVNTGGPASVYGDDGVATYPASVTTGGTAVDGSGRVYSMSPGGYRFPFIRPGNYRLDVRPPAGYRAPSTVATAALQALPGAPFAMVDPGSRNEQFVVNPGPAIHIDIPVDQISSRLYLIKSAAKDSAAIGDFVPYQLTVENIDTSAPAPGVTITDRLPVGFRYRKGSARLNSGPAPDPVISADGRSITFAAGDLSAAGQAVVTYVAEVAAGARLGKAVNTAVANGSSGIVSNTAAATVRVTEDLFMSKTTIVGRVVEGCVKNGRGIAGVRIFLEDGSYVVTDKNGMYHFAAVQAGTHVVQLDTVTVPDNYEPLQCEDNTRFAGTAFSQFVDLQGGSLWRADFHIAPRPPKEKQTGEVGLELRTSLVTAQTVTTRTDENSQNDNAAMVPFVHENCCLPGANGQYTVAYAANLHVGAVPVRNLRLVVMMPDGVTYTAGSSCLIDGRVPDPDFRDGVLTYRLGERSAGWKGSVAFLATASAQGVEGSLPTKAFLIFDTPAAKGVRTPVAGTNLVRYELKRQTDEPDAVFHPKFGTLKSDLSRSDRKEIIKIVEQMKARKIEHITVTGHSDSNPIRPGASKEFPDNYALSRSRAKKVAGVIAKALRLAPDQITIVGKGPDEPIAANKTAEGRALNRRVEIRVDTRKDSTWTYIRNDKEASGMKTMPVAGLAQGEVWVDNPLSEPTHTVGDNKTMPDYDAAWVEKTSPGLEWLWPREGYHPPIASMRLAVKHDPGQKPKLLLNGKAVDILHYEGMIKKSDGSVAVSLWRGVHLREGDNKFELILSDASGSEIKRLQRTVHYSGPPVKAVLLPERSKLIADGKTPITLAVRLLDKDGHPAREGVRADYFVDPPYIPQQRVDELQRSPLVGPNTDRYRYLIGDDGVAMIELVPTTQTGEVVLQLQVADGATQEIRTWLKPAPRDWILVGLAEGTAGYNVVKGNMETFATTGDDDKLYENDRLAFYAKGSIKGEWLLTMAYDSAKRGGSTQNGLHQTIDPNKYYTLYGDATDQRPDAASSSPLYLKIERDQFYALFGDYDTGLTVTELSRYSRQMTGVKSEMQSDHFNYTLFASRNDQAFVKDEIRGDGTSGLYQLSRKNIVLNSESVVIETRDRYRSEVILSSQPLARYLDYSIDYDTGTLYFKSPVFNTDANFNPIFIVVKYEIFDAAGNSYTYGGRGAVRVLHNKVELGATHIHEEENGGIGKLTGVDATVKVDEHTQIKTEIATSKTNEGGSANDGSAYLTELSHRSEKMDGKAYVREQSSGFGLGQQNNSETGTRKVGADLNYRFDRLWSAGGEVFRQNVLATGSVRDMAELRGRYTSGKYDLLAGVRSAEDNLTMGQAYRSDQLFASMKYQFTDRFALRISRDQSLGSNDNVDFPTKTTIGADYKLSESATFFADQEWTQGSGIDTETSRIGIKASPWEGGQIGSTMEQQSTENGVRLFSTTGLKQTWQITKKWSIDAGLDRSTTLRNTSVSTDGSTSPYLFNTNVPSAVGTTEDFTAVSLGAGYREEKWSWTTRIEDRVSTSEDKFGVFAGANGEVRDGLGLAAGWQAFRSAAVSGLEQLTSDLRLSLAYRPSETRVIILDRLDYLLNEQHGDGALDDNSWRVVNNFVTNIKTNSRTQLSVLYGAKYVQETIDRNDYRGYTDLTGLEVRYDITKKWDVGLRELMLHSWSVNQMVYGTGASVGYNAGKNMWVSVGYNFAGFRDRDFSQSDFTSEGPFVKLRLKFDQASVREAVKWFSGQ